MESYKIQKVGDENIRYIKKGLGEPLLFLHGFGLDVKKYENIIEKLSNKFEVIAPDMYAINYLKSQPTSIKEYAGLTYDFCNSIKLGKYKIVGHSMGGAVAFTVGNNSSEAKKLVGIDPILPTSYGFFGFVRKTNEILSKNKSLKKGFYINLLKNVKVSKKIVSDISDFNYENFDVKQPSLIIYGEDDEYFRLDDKIEKHVNKAFRNLTIKKFPKKEHVWLILEPDIAAKETIDFLIKSE
ncbi:MAG: alpha/beta hydrolase [Nanoarchaeota archaeon]|nr:alpha/beta hydrolase [Nanoarchaeota archaeon]